MIHPKHGRLYRLYERLRGGGCVFYNQNRGFQMCGNIDRNELACRLIQSVREAFENENISALGWREMTHILFSKLDSLGEDLCADVRHGPKGNKNWEFLYDVCFFVPRNRDPDDYFIPETPLKQALIVLECEWNRRNKKRDILYDFSKLLIARAELRVLVFYTTISSKDFNSTMKDVKALIAAFEQGAQCDRYLICGIGSQCLRFALVDGRGKELYRKNH